MICNHCPFSFRQEINPKYGISKKHATGPDKNWPIQSAPSLILYWTELCLTPKLVVGTMKISCKFENLKNATNGKDLNYLQIF